MVKEFNAGCFIDAVPETVGLGRDGIGLQWAIRTAQRYRDQRGGEVRVFIPQRTAPYILRPLVSSSDLAANEDWVSTNDAPDDAEPYRPDWAQKEWYQQYASDVDDFRFLRNSASTAIVLPDHITVYGDGVGKTRLKIYDRVSEDFRFVDYAGFTESRDDAVVGTLSGSPVPVTVPALPICTAFSVSRNGVPGALAAFDVCISDLEIDGNRLRNPYAAKRASGAGIDGREQCGIDFFRASQSVVRRVRVHDFPVVPLCFIYCADCLLVESRTGDNGCSPFPWRRVAYVVAMGFLGMGSKRTTISRCTSERNERYGFTFHKEADDNLVVDCLAEDNAGAGFAAGGARNRFVRCKSSGLRAGIFLDGDDGMITGCSVHVRPPKVADPDVPPHTSPAIYVGPGTRVVIAQNRVEQVTPASQAWTWVDAPGAAIAIEQSQSSATVVGNSIWALRRGIDADGASAVVAANHVQVSDLSTATLPAGAEYLTVPTAGIRVAGDSVAVVANKVEGHEAPALLLPGDHNPQNVSFSGNELKGLGASLIHGAGLSVASNRFSLPGDASNLNAAPSLKCLEGLATDAVILGNQFHPEGKFEVPPSATFTGAVKFNEDLVVPPGVGPTEGNTPPLFARPGCPD